MHIPLESSNVPEMADTCYEAELALSMAAWNCDIDTVEILLKHGASVEAVNNKGDNVFHSLIQVGLTPQTNLLLPTTFSVLFSSTLESI